MVVCLLVSWYPFSFIPMAKLRALKNDLKLWNTQSFGDISDRKKFMLEELQEFERI